MGTKPTSQDKPNERPAKIRLARDLGMESPKAFPAKTSINKWEALSQAKTKVQQNDAPKTQAKDDEMSRDLNNALAGTPSNNREVDSKTKSPVQTKEKIRDDAKLVDYPDKPDSEEFRAKTSVEPKAQKTKSLKLKNTSKDKTKDSDYSTTDELSAKISLAKEKAMKKKAKKKAKRGEKDVD